VRKDQLFAIGSIGKAFTALAILQAGEAGQLDVHAPVTDYLPWFSVQTNYSPITLHHLLTHSSGLPRGTDFSPDPRSEVFALRELQTGFAPGERFSYSDVGYKVLGLVLEAVTGQGYGDVIRSQILTPLEMNDTYASTTQSLRASMAVGCRFLYDDRPRHITHPLVPAAWVETNSGDGCIVSTAEDMTRFARMLLHEGVGPHGPILSAENCRKMLRPMIEDEGEAYGYGLYLFVDEGYRTAGHGGDVPGYESYMWLDLDNGLGAITLMTTPYTPRASFLALEFFRAASIGHALPETPPLPDFTFVADPLQYAGTYRSKTGEVVLKGDGHRLLLACGGRRVVLEERGADRFYANHPSWNRFLLRFGRSKEGKVIEVCYGPEWFVNERGEGQGPFAAPDFWNAFEGHYRSHNPWETNFRVFIRKGQLILSSPEGDEEVLIPLSDGSFRIGEDAYIPERINFDQVVDGQAQRAVRSGCPYYRFFTP
jgi:CubicO group peptidase (beta-lactamase class C family)